MRSAKRTKAVMVSPGGTRHQVLVGLIISGPYTLHPHTSPDTWRFYRDMATDGLVTEADRGKGRSEFAITPEAEVEAKKASEYLREHPRV